MGWFTHESKGWEIKNALVLLGVVGVTSILSLGVLTPLAIHIFGSIVQMTRWTKQSLYIALFYFLFLLVALFILLANQEASYVILFSIVSFYVYTLFMSLHLGEYLQRLDLKKYMNLQNNHSYSYAVTYKQVHPTVELKSSKALFNEALEEYKNKINKLSIKQDISELQRLASLILQDDSRESELFFARHNSAILNILQQYVELDQSYLKNIDNLELSEKLETVISKAKTAFEQELSQMIQREVLQVDAESEVYISLLKAKGLL